LSNIRDVDAKKFVWKSIVTRFGIPHTLISDNGLQFDSKAFRRYCYEFSIRNRYSTLAYPQGNVQAEAVNKVIVSGLKRRLDEERVDGPKSAHIFFGRIRQLLIVQLEKCLFSMTYGSEVVIPLETGFLMLRTSLFTPNNNDQLLERSLNLTDEKREATVVHLTHYQQKLK